MQSRRRSTGWAALLLAACAMLAIPPAAWAQATPQRSQKAAAAEKQLRATRARIKALADEQKKIEAERDAAAAQLRQADGQVAASQRSLAATQARIAEQQARLDQLQARQAQLEASLSRQRSELAVLLRSAYAMGRHQQLKLLLEQDRMADLARVLAYHRYFQRDRQSRISGLQQELQALAELGEQVRQQQAGLLAERDRQQAELSALAAHKQSRRQLLRSLDGKYRDRKTRLAALGRDEKSTAALLERLRKLMSSLPKAPRTPSTPGKPRPGDARIPLGPMQLPLAGSILAGYGGTMPDGHKSQGLLIAGSAGATVQAVRAGRVAYADWLKGYGLLLILDHGGGWMSLYAFNDTLLKATGDSVQAGEAISTVGSSGGQGRPALYFELRRNGQPQDPAGWLKR